MLNKFVVCFDDDSCQQGCNEKWCLCARTTNKLKAPLPRQRPADLFQNKNKSLECLTLLRHVFVVVIVVVVREKVAC